MTRPFQSDGLSELPGRLNPALGPFGCPRPVCLQRWGSSTEEML